MLKAKQCGQHGGPATQTWFQRNLHVSQSVNLSTALGLLENDVPLNDVLHKQVGKLIKSPAQTVSINNYFHDDKCKGTRNEVARTETESIAAAKIIWDSSNGIVRKLGGMNTRGTYEGNNNALTHLHPLCPQPANKFAAIAQNY